MISNLPYQDITWLEHVILPILEIRCFCLLKGVSRCSFGSIPYLKECLLLEVLIQNEKGSVVSLYRSPSQTQEEFNDFLLKDSGRDMIFWCFVCVCSRSNCVIFLWKLTYQAFEDVARNCDSEINRQLLNVEIWYFEKQPSVCVLIKRCSENM